MSEILKVQNLVKHFSVQTGFLGETRGIVHALDGVSFAVNSNETFGVVGESGCGKSTLAKLIARLQEPTLGRILFENNEITGLTQSEFRPIRKDIQIVFQDPYASLNPRMTAGEILSEPLSIYHVVKGKDIRDRIMQLLDIVGLGKDAAAKYPHEFSGGQRQRIGIARAIALNPKLIIADEPISALDVSIQAQIINLFIELQKKFNLAYIFITHDLRVIQYSADRVMVMYMGKIMELAKASDIFKTPLHPYTQALMSAIPTITAKKIKRIILKGEIPSPMQPPSGCRFHTRCIYVQKRCVMEEPQLIERGKWPLACHFPLG